MTAKSDLPQGTLDLLILKVVALGPVHGYAIAQRLQQVSRDVVQVPQGSLYPALHRLENRGLLAADWKETETGREAKFYRLTRKGRAQLETETASWQRLSEAVGLILDVRGRRRMTWWQRLWRRRQLEDQLEKELRFHLDQHTADLIARRTPARGSAPPGAARARRSGTGQGELPRRARHTLAGGPLAGFALRAAHAAAEAGICGRRAVDAGARHRRHHRHVHRDQRRSAQAAALSRTRQAGRAAGTNGTGDAVGQSLGIHLPEFPRLQAREPLSRHWRRGATAAARSAIPAKPSTWTAVEISSGLFSVLGVTPSIGRAFLPEEDRPGAAPVAIISHGLWQRRFGASPAAIGAPLVFDGKPYTVVGIMPAGFRLGERRGGCVHAARPEHCPRMQNRETHPGIQVVGAPRGRRDAGPGAERSSR